MTDVAELAREHRSSIELQRAKDGSYYWTVKRYYDETSITALSTAIADLTEIDDRLRTLFLPVD